MSPSNRFDQRLRGTVLPPVERNLSPYRVQENYLIAPLGPVPPRHFFPRSCCQLLVRHLPATPGGGPWRWVRPGEDDGMPLLPHLCPRISIFLASHLGQCYHHPQDPSRKLKSNLDFFSLLLSFLMAAMAKFKQSSRLAWPVATTSKLVSLSLVFPSKTHPGVSTSIFLGSTFTWFVPPQWTFSATKERAQPLAGRDQPSLTLSLPLPRSPPGFSAPGLPTVCGRCHLCLCRGCSSMGNALRLLCCLVTSRPPSRAPQMRPLPHPHPSTWKHLGYASGTSWHLL